ncbi:MAG: hypothetical protein JO044_01800 [Mycobacteriaceae bacterium]|nr:hypothetical protein [Mycobacteriaceae bacterium]MBV9638724.1 hypothetical protein [Mycobacteriaceae bacterium]
MASHNRVILAGGLVLTGWIACAGICRADPPAPLPAPKTSIDHDGTFVVGTDIAPGTYTSAGPVTGGTCYWKRLSSLNGKDIIDNALSQKPQVVDIDPSDKAFKTDGCQPWQKSDSASAPDELPAPNAQAQLHADIDNLNGAARQFGGAQLPAP